MACSGSVESIRLRIIGTDHDGRALSSEQSMVRQHPERFELETALSEMSGITFRYELVEPGLLMKNSRVLVRSVVRGRLKTKKSWTIYLTAYSIYKIPTGDTKMFASIKRYFQRKGSTSSVLRMNR